MPTNMFDVVSHNFLIGKLFLSGTAYTWWSIKGHNVQYNGHQPIHSSARHSTGGVASTVDYKEYVNDLLMTLEDSGVGAFMGDIYY